MFKTQRSCWNTNLCRSIILGGLAALIVPQSIQADPPPDPKEQSVPVQLRIIRETLAEMEYRLSTQMYEMESNLETAMGDMESRLDATMGDIQSSVNIGNSKIDDLQASADEIITILNTPVVDIKTELCLDEGVMAGLAGGAHGEFGVGWPNVLDAKAILEGAAGFGVEVGVANTICIEIPLYSVDSNEAFLNYFDFDTSEFDDMIGNYAAGARLTVPLFAAIYGELMPTPEEAVEALDNYLIAGANFSVLGRSTTLYDPIDLVTPHVLLEPVIPDIFEKFVAEIPDTVDSFVANPCIGLDLSPLGKVLRNDPAYNWLCGASTDVMYIMSTSIETMFGWIDTMYDWVKSIFNWLP